MGKHRHMQLDRGNGGIFREMLTRWTYVQMQKGGFGYVYIGTYDARANPNAARKDMKVVVKLPTEDSDAVAAFNSER